MDGTSWGARPGSSRTCGPASHTSRPARWPHHPEPMARCPDDRRSCHQDAPHPADGAARPGVVGSGRSVWRPARGSVDRHGRRSFRDGDPGDERLHPGRREPRRLCQLGAPTRLRQREPRWQRPGDHLRGADARHGVHRMADLPLGSPPGARRPADQLRRRVTNRSLQNAAVPLTSACGASHGTKCPQSRSRNGPTCRANTAAAIRSKAG